MLDHTVIQNAIEAHCRTLSTLDKEGWLSIWADQAVLEDPVGVDTFRGKEVLSTTFWKLVEQTSPLQLKLRDEVIVCGQEAIAILSASSSWGGTTHDVGPLMDHFTFGPDGKITTMRAHWNFAKHGYRPEKDVDPARRDLMIEAIETACRAENELDKQTWLNLFAEDAVVEDPVGVNTQRGIDALATTFWSSVERARPRIQLLDDVIVCGNEAIAILSAKIHHEGQQQTFQPIVVNYVFDEAGKVRHLRSFFNYG
jgi:steroid delta-isomerase